MSVDLGNGTKWTPGDSIGVVEKWEWPSDTSVADEINADQLQEIKARIAQGEYGENAQADDWAGKVFADVLGMNVRDDKDKVSHMMAGAVKQGHFVVVKRRDKEKGRVRPMYEVAGFPHHDSGGVGPTVH